MLIKVAAVVILLLLLIVRFTSHNTNCPTQRVTFISEPTTTVSCSRRNVSFICQYAYTNGAGAQPDWIINSSLYTYPAVVNSLPPGHTVRPRADGAELVITNVNTSLNGISYQCRLLLSDSSGDCLYHSSEDQKLIVIDCRAPSVQCLLIKHANGRLKEIFVNLTKTSGIETNYTVSVVDFINGHDCGSFNITSSSCSGDICSDDLHVPSDCLNLLAFNVTVSTTAYEAITEPLKVDTSDNVSVAIQLNADSPADSSIQCTFNEDAPPMEEKPYRCNFLYGPVTDNCNDLPYRIHDTRMGSTTLQIADFNLTFIDTTMRICLVLEAFSGDKSWTQVAIYEIDDIMPTSPSTSKPIDARNFGKGSSASTPMSSIYIYGLLILKCILELVSS